MSHVRWSKHIAVSLRGAKDLQLKCHTQCSLLSSPILPCYLFPLCAFASSFNEIGSNYTEIKPRVKTMLLCSGHTINKVVVLEI